MILNILGCIAALYCRVQCLIEQSFVYLLVVHPELFEQLTQVFIIAHSSCFFNLISIVLRKDLVRLLACILVASAARWSLQRCTTANIDNSHCCFFLLMRRQLDLVRVVILLVILASMLRFILHMCRSRTVPAPSGPLLPVHPLTTIAACPSTSSCTVTKLLLLLLVAVPLVIVALLALVWTATAALIVLI